MKGNSGCNSVNHLKVNGNITDKKEVAEVFAKKSMNFRGLKH